MQDEPSNAPEAGQALPDEERVIDFPSIGEKDNPYPRKDSRALASALAGLMQDVRLNTRSRRYQWRGDDPSDPDKPLSEWRDIDKRWCASIRERIAAAYFVRQEGNKVGRLHWGRDAFNDVLDALLFDRDRHADPLIDWLEDLPPWDGEDRLRLVLNTVFDAPLDELTLWASRFLFCGVVQRAYEPGSKIDQAVVLIGGQGIGKSTMLSAMLPPAMPGLFRDALEWDAPTQKKTEATLGCAIVEISEMAGRRRAEIEGIKTYVVRRDDGNVRLAYAHTPESLPRRFILVGTTNEVADLPNDPSGLRRFVPIPLAGNRVGSIEAFMDRNRDQLWAEALAEYRDGYRAGLPRDLMPAQRERAEEHRDRDDVLEDAVAALQTDGPDEIATIMNLLGDAARGASRAPRRPGAAKCRLDQETGAARRQDRTPVETRPVSLCHLFPLFHLFPFPHGVPKKPVRLAEMGEGRGFLGRQANWGNK